MPRAPTTADVFNAIAERRRRQIVELLAQRGAMPVGTLVVMLGLPQPAVSKHLGVLRKVGLVAVIIFYFGRMIARAVIRALDRVMASQKLDISLRKFLHDVVYAVMLVAVVIAALDAVGVRTTAVIAVLGAAGLAVGLALQGSLSNFAAGVMLIMLRPYKVGDLVVTSGAGGVFPRGIPVGRVRAIDDRGSALFHYAQLTPAVDFARIDEVLLIVGEGNHDLASLFAGPMP